MSYHTLPRDEFARLARGDGDMLGVLGDGQRSKRLLLLHHLVAMVRDQDPELYAEAQVGQSFAQIVDAQRRSPHGTDAVLLRPQVGAWATAALGAVLAGRIRPADIGPIGALAAVCALRAHRAFRVRAFLRDGTVMLPTFGMARLGTQNGWCAIRARSESWDVEISAGGVSSSIRLHSTKGDGQFVPLRRLRSSAAGLDVEIELDDLDPYRACKGLDAALRLDATEVDDWQVMWEGAWRLLVEAHPAHAAAISAGVTAVVPLLSEGQFEQSGSCQAAVGAVAMTHPRTPLTTALALVHEFQHTKLAALLDLVTLLEPASAALLYSPWRPDPRPPRGILHGAYAFLGLAAFWQARRVGDSSRAEFELALGVRQVADALRTLQGSEALRPLGADFLGHMWGRLKQMRRNPPAIQARSLARTACLDHATCWRLRNAQPDRMLVADWADAWLRGRACRWAHAKLTVTSGEGASPSEARLALLRCRLSTDDEGVDWRDGTPADRLLLAGKVGQARDAYCAQIDQNPHDFASWGGLGRAIAPQQDAASWALLTAPECVYALYHEVRNRRGVGPDPEALAGWLGRGWMTT